MKFHRFKIAKLIRDKLPDIRTKEGYVFELRYLQGQEHINHLKLKLLEEAAEVQEATIKSELTEEIADVLEVIHALAAANDISLEDIEIKRKEKAEMRGGFTQGTYCAYMDIPADHPAVKKFQAMPNKYPEIAIIED